jgi:hypothetical protein
MTTGSSATLRDLLPVSKDYSRFNREERNYAAILYHLLLKPGGLAKFLEILGHSSVDPAAAKLYFEYAHARDLWCEFGVVNKCIDSRNRGYHKAIVSLLQPPDRLELPPVTEVKRFNHFFHGPPPFQRTAPLEVTRASARQIQMPGRWSHTMFNEWERLGGRDFAERACRLKWAFNVKPDLVIQTSPDSAICVEIKVVSKEGNYSMGIAGSRFPMTQTEMQEYVLKTLLGYETQFVFLSRDGGIPEGEVAANGKSPRKDDMKELRWSEVFEALMPSRDSASSELDFVYEMTESAVLGARQRKARAQK